MIELLLQAERELTAGMLDRAERLYRQALEADARNAIAVTGLARVAIERADDRSAYLLARRALALDPENPAAGRLAARLAEVMTHRGEPLPVDDAAVGTTSMPARESSRAAPAPASHSGRRGVLGRLFGRR